MAKRGSGVNKKGLVEPILILSHNMFCDPIFCLMADGGASDEATSDMGPSRPKRAVRAMSVIPPIATEPRTSRHVSNV